MPTYTKKKTGDKYVIFEDAQPLRTPAGKIVTTLYKKIADRILLDLKKYGLEFHSADSILAWHFTTIDSFAPMGHEKTEQLLCDCFFRKEDWTCQESHGKKWDSYFGKWDGRKKKIANWLHAATIMQMTAACCIGNAYHSLNLAFTLALIMEKQTGDNRAKAFEELAYLLEKNSPYGPASIILKVCQTFELYYGIHLEEKGPILNDVIEGKSDQPEDLDVDNLTAFSLTKEQLIGRNYYYYTNYQIDELQPGQYALSDFELENSSDEEDVEEYMEEDEEEDGEENNESELNDYLPDKCWIKRFVDDDDTGVNYILYIVIDENGKITNSGCVQESSQRMGGGGMFFMMTGVELPCVKSYTYNFAPPEKVMNDLRMLFSGRSLPLDFSFVQKRLPQKMIDKGGNGGSNTEYTYAMQSAYRLAYMHMSIDTNEDGIIENFDYSSYQSSGNEYGDMFSHPTRYTDRRDEAIDMLLYIYDMYTNDEIERINKS